jgi:hypothetical protein
MEMAEPDVPGGPLRLLSLCARHCKPRTGTAGVALEWHCEDVIGAQSRAVECMRRAETCMRDADNNTCGQQHILAYDYICVTPTLILPHHTHSHTELPDPQSKLACFAHTYTHTHTRVRVLAQA